MTGPRVLIDHVDQHARIVQAYVTDQAGTQHRLGHLPGEGWFCTTCRHTRCGSIQVVADLIVPMEDTP